jgi:hypothetical protein
MDEHSLLSEKQVDDPTPLHMLPFATMRENRGIVAASVLESVT